MTTEEIKKLTDAQLDAAVRAKALEAAAAIRKLTPSTPREQRSLVYLIVLDLKALVFARFERGTAKELTADPVGPDRPSKDKPPTPAAIKAWVASMPDKMLVGEWGGGMLVLGFGEAIAGCIADEIVRRYAPGSTMTVLGAGLIWPLGAGAVGYVLGGWPAGLLGAAVGYLVSAYKK